MHQVKWFEVTAFIWEKKWERNFYFAEYSNGKFMFLRPIAYSTGYYDNLGEAVQAFKAKFEQEHNFAQRGLTLSICDPHEVPEVKVKSMTASELHKQLSEDEFKSYFMVP
jgi:hypothetical protein